MSHTKESTFCQMSMTKPNFLLKNCLTNVYRLNKFAKLLTRYTFNTLIQKLTEYTSYEVVNLCKVVPNKKTTCHEE
jgi:hypothetical protein